MPEEVNDAVESIVPGGSPQVVQEIEDQIGADLEPVADDVVSEVAKSELDELREELRREKQAKKDLRYELERREREEYSGLPKKVAEQELPLSQRMREEGTYDELAISQQERLERIESELATNKNEAFLALADGFIAEHKIPEGSELAEAFFKELDLQLADYKTNIGNLVRMIGRNEAVVPDTLVKTMPHKLKTALRLATSSLAEKKNAKKADDTLQKRSQGGQSPTKGAAPNSAPSSWEGLSYQETQKRIRAGTF